MGVLLWSVAAASANKQTKLKILKVGYLGDVQPVHDFHQIFIRLKLAVLLAFDCLNSFLCFQRSSLVGLQIVGKCVLWCGFEWVDVFGLAIDVAAVSSFSHCRVFSVSLSHLSKLILVISFHFQRYSHAHTFFYFLSVILFMWFSHSRWCCWKTVDSRLA